MGQARGAEEVTDVDRHHTLESRFDGKGNLEDSPGSFGQAHLLYVFRRCRRSVRVLLRVLTQT